MHSHAVNNQQHDQEPLAHLIETARDMVATVPGKHEFVGRALHKAPHSLMNELNPLNPAKFGLLDAVKTMQLTDDYRLLDAICDECGFTSIRIEDYSGASDLELLEVYAKMHAKVGTLAHEVAQALLDHTITSEEVRQVRAAGMHMVRALFAFLARMEAVSE